MTRFSAAFCAAFVALWFSQGLDIPFVRPGPGDGVDITIFSFGAVWFAIKAARGEDARK